MLYGPKRPESHEAFSMTNGEFMKKKSYREEMARKLIKKYSRSGGR
jgi:hypothetical protein